jgi:hypothetical protein
MIITDKMYKINYLTREPIENYAAVTYAYDYLGIYDYDVVFTNGAYVTNQESATHFDIFPSLYYDNITHISADEVDACICQVEEDYGATPPTLPTADFYEYLAQLEYVREHFSTMWRKDM